MQTEGAGDQLWRIVRSLDIVYSRQTGTPTQSKIVGGSKALHHILLELMPPIDREYTAIFLGRIQAQHFQNRTQEAETFRLAFESFRAIAKSVNPVQYVGRHQWDTSRTKVIDNAIVGFIRYLRNQSESVPPVVSPRLLTPLTLGPSPLEKGERSAQESGEGSDVISEVDRAFEKLDGAAGDTDGVAASFAPELAAVAPEQAGKDGATSPRLRGPEVIGDNLAHGVIGAAPHVNSFTRRAVAQTAVILVPVALTFVAAGTLQFWQGGLFWLVFLASTTATGIYLMRRDRALLERRMRVGPQAESRPRQKIIVALIVVMFVALAIVPGLDYRFGWSRPPALIVIIANLLVVASFGLMLLVLRENTFAASTITVEAGQRVIATGPYAHVRHPMYAAAGLLLFTMPIALGSWWGLLVAALACPLLIARIFDEERALSAELAGYDDYCRAVPYRLIPRVW
jgi:protein-S-isoprenylcysteine O-methyltransferase Ste14